MTTPINRRDFLRGAGVASAAALTGAIETSTAQTASLPAPSASQIDHIVVVMMENRSFDHMLGWLPGANGKVRITCQRPAEFASKVADLQID